MKKKIVSLENVSKCFDEDNFVIKDLSLIQLIMIERRERIGNTDELSNVDI